MRIRVDKRTGRYILFVLAALTINLVDAALVRSIAHPGYRTLVALGATVDVVIIVTAVYYWLLVRPGIRARWSLVPISLAGLLHAVYLFPNAAAERAIVAGLCELTLFGFLATRIWRKLQRSSERCSDPVETIREILAPVFPIPTIANIMATELSIFYYALFSWRAKPHVSGGAKAFSIHKRAGTADVLFALAIATLVELIPVHLLLQHWSPVWAWIVTGLTIYGAVWLAGLARSIELRPVLVTHEYLDVRYGLLFRPKIPRTVIEDIRVAQGAGMIAETVVPPRSEPNLCLRLAAPLIAEMPFGLRKRVNRLALAVDDAAAFQQALTAPQAPPWDPLRRDPE